MKTPEAKPFDQKCRKLKARKSTVYNRPCSRPAPRGKIESIRRHSEVIKQFDSFSLLKLLLKLLLFVRNWHCWSPKAFLRQTSKPKKNCKDGRFSNIADRHEKLYGRRGCAPAPKDATKLAVSFRFFRIFPLTFSIKKTACRGDLQTFKACFV